MSDTLEKTRTPETLTSIDPYAPPQAAKTGELVGAQSFEAALATPLRRLAGAVLSQILGLLFILPFFVGAALQVEGRSLPTSQSLPMMVAVVALFISVNGANLWLALRRSQTIGKWLVGTQIVGEDGAPAGFGAIALRSFAESGMWSVLFFFAAIDGLFVFSADRRTLHDRIANTWVVNLDDIETLRMRGVVLGSRPVQPKHAIPSVIAARPALLRRLGAGALSWTVAFVVVPAPFYLTLSRGDGPLLWGSLGTGLMVGVWGLLNLASIRQHGTSLVRRLFGLQLVDAHGHPMSSMAEQGRVVVEYCLTYLLLGFCMSPVAFLGYLPILWGRRGLYELLVGGWVVHGETLARETLRASTDLSGPFSLAGKDV